MMTKRKSGWYRVWVHENETRSRFLLTNPCIMKWNSEDELFHAEYWSYRAQDFYKIDPQMVMTTSGEIVYHNNEHNPLYNTQQDG